MAKVEKGMAAIADSYDSLLLDQFGVLHDGRVAYPAALDAVRRLAEAGKRLVILSNSGVRPTAACAMRLRAECDACLRRSAALRTP